jgi:uncharacterized metal-binding protein
MIMEEKKDCGCSAAPKLIFACSGAADVGAVADQAARALSKQGNGKMFCLAGVGGRVSGIMETTESACCILAIDGCGLDCTKHTLEQAGFTEYKHMRVTDLGMEKGKTEVNEDNIQKTVQAGTEKLSCC